MLDTAGLRLTGRRSRAVPRNATACMRRVVGTQLVQRHREGLQLTKAGAVLLDASRTVLSLVDHEVNRTRQAAGLGRQRLRVVVPPRLPDVLAVEAASALRSAAAAADVDLVWMEAPLDAGFSLIQQRRADAGPGWPSGPVQRRCPPRSTPRAWASSNPMCGSLGRTPRRAAARSASVN